MPGSEAGHEFKLGRDSKSGCPSIGSASVDTVSSHQNPRPFPASSPALAIGSWMPPSHAVRGASIPSEIVPHVDDSNVSTGIRDKLGRSFHTNWVGDHVKDDSHVHFLSHCPCQVCHIFSPSLITFSVCLTLPSYLGFSNFQVCALALDVS